MCDAYGANSVETLVGDNFEYRVGGAGYPLDSYREPFLKNFARNIRLGDEYAPPISFKEHQNTMRVVNACYESIYTGKEIKIEYPED